MRTLFLASAVLAAVCGSTLAANPESIRTDQRRPTPQDGYSRGYFAAGTLSQVAQAAWGSGYDANTKVTIAGCTTGGAVQPNIWSGYLVSYTIKTPFEGCVSPTVTVTDPGGAGAGARAVAYVSKGSIWLGPDNAVYQIDRDTDGKGGTSTGAVWSNLHVASLPGDAGGRMVWGGGWDKLRRAYAGAAASVIVPARGVSATPIGFVDNRLDRSAVDALAGANQPYVSLINDQSGSGNHAATLGTFGTLLSLDLTEMGSRGGSGYRSGSGTCTGGSFTVQPTFSWMAASGVLTALMVTGAGTYDTTKPPSAPACTPAGGIGAKFATRVGDAPQIAPVNLVGDAAGFHFPNFTDQPLFHSFIEPTGKAKPEAPLLIGNGLAVPNNNVTLIWLGAVNNSYRQTPVMALTGANAILDWGHNTAFNGMSAIPSAAGSGDKPAPGIALPITPSVAGVTVTPAATTHYLKGGVYAYTTTTIAPSGVTAGALLGCTFKIVDGGGNPICGGVTIRDVLVFSPALTDAQFIRVAASLAQVSKIAPQSTGAILAAGDSIVDGYYNEFAQSASKMASTMLSRHTDVYNVGIATQTLKDQTGASGFMKNWTNLCTQNQGRGTYGLVAEGTNDIFNRASAATIWGYLQEVFGKASVAGCSLALADVLPRVGYDGTNLEVVRQTLNAMEAAHWPALGASAFEQRSVDVTIGTQTALKVKTLYADGTHLAFSITNTLARAVAANGQHYAAQLDAAIYNAQIGMLP